MGRILLYIGGLLPLLWGISHLFPTQNVVKGFGNISRDNIYIITMEWIVEGAALIFTGLLVITITYIDPISKISSAVYISVSCFMFVMAIISLFTGFKIAFLPFRLCPVIFGSSAVLIISGWGMII